MNDYRREARDRIAAEVLELWNAPAKGETVIKLNESKIKALFELYSAFIYTEVSGPELINKTLWVIREELFGELGRQQARDELATEKAARSRSRKASQAADGHRTGDLR